MVANFLEGDLQSEIQIPHLRVGCYVGDISTAAVHAVIGLAEVHVVEDIERFKPELRCEALRDRGSS